jgi:DNA polymerase-3 subunit delta'
MESQGYLETILKQFEEKKAAHTYLLTGARGIGKFEVFKSLAKKLQSQKNSLDTIVLEDDGHKIKISEMRAVIERLNRSKQDNYKLLLIENIERFSLPAANSFLKTLEEPLENTYFFLTSSNLKNVLETIISRVRLLRAGGIANTNSNMTDLVKKCLANQFLLSEKFVLVENFKREDALEFSKVMTFKLRELVKKDHETKYLEALKELAKANKLLNGNINPRLFIENILLLLN